jgi:lysophospholipase L1-like esterase
MSIDWKGCVSVLVMLAMFGGAAIGGATTVPCDNPDFGLCPYAWKASGTGNDVRVEAAMPGAYLKTVVKGTAKIDLLIDGAANEGCPLLSMPYVEYSVDDGPFNAKQLSQTGTLYPFPLASGLDPAAPHKLEVHFRAADLGQKRWTASTAHLRIFGLALDDGGTLAACPKRARRAIGFGDSITEGVGVDGLFTSWQSLGVNNARGSWFPVVCAALDCEYGQFGSGGQGMVRELEMPGLPKTWDHYDAAASRLTGGLLLPEPDYVFCNMGTNDFGGIDITGAYADWLAAVRKACPRTHIFCVVPPSGVHRGEIRAAVAARIADNDHAVHLIDTPSLNSMITVHPPGATQLCCDGVHPTVQGQGIFGACIVAQVQQVLDGH